MIEQLRETCRAMLAEGRVKVVIGYGQVAADGPVFPVFVTQPEDAGMLVWNDRCLMNLTKYLTRPEVRAMGKPAIVVKGCDARALVVLEQESQITRSEIVVIGMACATMRQAGCIACDVHMPPACDVVIGEVPNPAVTAEQRYAALEAFWKKTPAERMAHWQVELARCVKCYACRQACPLCYCQRCIVDKNRPTIIDTSATLKGNFAWHITRAFHLAGRCVGCDQCSRACPVGIDLSLLNQSLAKAAEDEFAYRAGMDPQNVPVIGNYSDRDEASFIR
jgi:formate dehydrogenase (coenzyme F420) beta subunit